MEKESKKFIDLFYNNKIYYYTETDGIIIEKLLMNSSLFNYEAPDIVVVNNDTILLIEHFEIDASRSIKSKGNLDKIEKHKRKLKFDAYANSLNSKSVSLTMKVDCKYSKEYYINNLVRSYNQHYAKIDKYVSNVLNEAVTDKNKEIKKAFFIEDTNPLGSYHLVDGMPKSIVLFFMIEFLELIKESSNLDYIFFSNHSNDKQSAHFMSINDESIKKISENALNIDDKDFFCFEPVEVAYREIITE